MALTETTLPGAATTAAVGLMREWISECADGGIFQDLDPLEDDVQDLSDLEVVRGIARHYSGGVAAFLADAADLLGDVR